MKELQIYEDVDVARLGTALDNRLVRVRGFVNAVRHTRFVSFVCLREMLDTVQAVVETGEEDPLGAKELLPESFVEICGVLKSVTKPVKGCTKKDVEIQAKSLRVVSPVLDTLPFSIKDAGASEKEKTANKSICNVSMALRLDNRFLDLRVPVNCAIIRVVDGAMTAFRGFLKGHSFTEIKTTKIIQSGSEGGSNLFSMSYFGKTAYLAQSPQLYKQMAIAGGLRRVFEIGHVYRAEVSNVNRYLSEFTGVDVEMELINGDWMEVVRFVHSMLTGVFDAIRHECSREIDVIREYRPFEDPVYTKDPVIIRHRDAVDMLKTVGVESSYDEDFSRENERLLGDIVKREHGVDLFVIVEYPPLERAFYTYVDPATGKSHSYDFILRGEEVLSGAQRVVDPAALKNALEQRGVGQESLGFYIDCFKYGVPPHAGCGIGLERLLKSFFGFDDIRYFALFPRDPSRIHP